MRCLIFKLNSWAFGSIVVIALALCFVIWKAGSITIAKLGLTIGGSNKKEKLKSPHANCPSFKGYYGFSTSNSGTL